MRNTAIASFLSGPDTFQNACAVTAPIAVKTAQHAGPKPNPATDQNQHRAGEFNEDAQKRHGRWLWHAGLRHFGDPAGKIGDLAEPGSQKGHNQRKTREGPGPWPFKDRSDKFGRGQIIHLVAFFST
jgi:hypothetical protein